MTTTIKKEQIEPTSKISLKKALLFRIVGVVLLLTVSFSITAQRTYTWVGGTSIAWNNTANWSQSPTGGTFPGDGAANDIVVINTFTTFQPTLSTTLNNSIASISFGTGANITLTITGVTLNVTGAITVNSIAANTARTYGIAGDGILNCATFNFGTDVAPATNNSVPTFQLNCTIAQLNITGNLTLYASFATTNRRRNPVFNHTAGTVTVGGSLRTTHENTATTCTYTLGGTNPRLILSGTTPYSMNTNGTAGTNTFTFTTGTDATVEYSSSSNVSIPSSPAGALSYRNLEISGGGGNIKTPAGNLTVNGVLTVDAASTLAMGTNTLGTPTSIVLGTIGGGNGAAITGTTGLITLGGGITVNYSGTGSVTSGASINKVMSLGTAVRTFTINDDGDATTTDLTISSVISDGTGGGITKEGAGTLLLSGANTYTAGFTMNAGILNINNASALGNAAGTFTISGGTIQNTTGGLITTNNHPMQWNGDFSFTGTQSLNLGTGAVTMGFSIEISIDPSITLTVGGTVNNPTRNLIKAGSGSLNFTNQTVSLNGLTIDVGTLTASSGTMNISGAFTNNATFVNNGGTVNMNAASSSIVNTSSLTFNNLTIDVTPTSQAQYNASYSVAGALTINGGVTFAPTGGTITMSAAGSSIANSGTKTFNNLTIAATPTAQSQYNTSFEVAGALTVNGGVTFAPTGGTITMSAVGSSISNGGTLTFQNLVISATPTAQSQYNTSYNVASVLTINGGVIFAPTGGTITMNDAASSISNSGTLTFNNITVSATPTSQTQYNTSFSVAGTFATSGAITFAPTGGTITMSGSSGAINNPSGTLTFQNLTISGTTVSSTGNFAVAATMSVTGVFNPSATSIISGGTGTITGTGTVNVTRTAATPSFGVQYTINTKTLGSLTVNYNGAGAQTVDAQNYGNLTISTNGTRTVTFINGGTIRVSGVFTPTATTTTYVVSNNTFEYNGSGAQTITAFTYNSLILSNAGAKTVLAGTTVNCLTITLNDAAVLTLPDTSTLNVTQ